jgi:hypothetical protein
LGEIDCRLGIVEAVQKDYYSSINEGINALLDIVSDVLQELVGRNLTVFVHPIAPVLDETRTIVMEFNYLCKLKIKKLNHHSIRWLDFDDQLVSADKPILQLKEKYVFDGAHLHPDYLKVLESSLL